MEPACDVSLVLFEACVIPPVVVIALIGAVLAWWMHRKDGDG